MKLSRTILYAIFIVSVASIILTFIMTTFFQYSLFTEDKIHIKEEYIQLRQQEIKREVLKVLDYIAYRQKAIDKEVRKKLQERVDQAYTIAMSLYEENKDKKNKEELQQLIVTALKDISFDNKRAYFFINSNQGRAILFNKKSKLQQYSNVWDLKDKKGNYIVRRQSKLAQEKKEGFVVNYFVKPDLNDYEQYPKLSYVKLFEPFDWHIGMGEYIDDMTHKTKQEVLSYIASIRFGTDGYIFVNNTSHQALVFDGKYLQKPKYYPNEKLYMQQLNAIKNKEGDFFFYKFKKLNSEIEFPKMAYVKAYEKWGWIIGSGVYIDEIDNEIVRQENVLLNSILDRINAIFIFIFIMAIVIFFISKQISKYVNQNIIHLIKSFNEAARQNRAVKAEKLTYKEFKTLAKSLNAALDSKNKTEEKLKEYISIINENVITSTTDKDGVITNVSEAFCKVTGYSKEELIGQPHSIIRHEKTENETYEKMWKDISQGFSWQGEFQNRRKDGSSYWVYVVIKPILEDNKVVAYTAIMQDVTDKKRIETLSITDDLTQLYNRRYFNDIIVRELNRAKRENQYITFMMLDVDYFKFYNDTYGHHAGDLVLKQVAAVLSSHAKRASDYAFRLGGEEFGLLYIHRDINTSEQMALEVKQDIEQLNIKHETSKISQHITISIGVVCQEALSFKSSDVLYKLADEALYKAKYSGRNCIHVSR